MDKSRNIFGAEQLENTFGQVQPEETRIRLLTSFQESYLEDHSNPFSHHKPVVTESSQIEPSQLEPSKL
jgi:hypothetical protein